MKTRCRASELLVEKCDSFYPRNDHYPPTHRSKCITFRRTYEMLPKTKSGYSVFLFLNHPYSSALYLLLFRSVVCGFVHQRLSAANLRARAFCCSQSVYASTQSFSSLAADVERTWPLICQSMPTAAFLGVGDLESSTWSTSDPDPRLEGGQVSVEGSC